jgi:hypothetical protein
MRDPKPGEEINGTIGQDEILGKSRYPNGAGVNGVQAWIGQSSSVPGFLIVKKSSVQSGILGPSLLPVYPHRMAKNRLFP